MYTRLVSFALVLSFASTTYGIVIGDFENDMDGWVMHAGAPAGLTIDYNDTFGVTLNNYSLKIYVPVGQIENTWWIEALHLNLLADPNSGLVDEFFSNDTFSMDVTRLVPDWPPTDWQANAFMLIVNADSDLGCTWCEENDSGVLGDSEYWTTTDPDPNLTRTITWDYSAVKEDIDPCSVLYLDFFLILKTANYTEGTYYFDNFQLYSNVLPRNPSPADGATDVQIEPTLSWTPGAYADTHNVYFGTNFNDVNNANTDNLASYPNVTFVNIDVNSYKPEPLEFNTTYYWRVDEVNDAHPDRLWRGTIWSFTTSDFLVVDNMESYGDAETPGPPPPAGSRIWYTWKDGNGWTIPSIVEGNGSGSVVDRKDNPVRGGTQSLGYWYDNDGTNWLNHSGKDYYSEVRADTSHLMAGQDWTKDGVKALTLWFYGDTDNDANATEQMYVKLNGVKVNYDGDMNDIQQASWQEWNIDLAEFGIDLTNVTEIAIGFGDENNTTPGGSGVVYFDDIRLYRVRCLPTRRKPVGDFDNDCQVSHSDLAVMADDWLVADYNAETLMSWYKFDEGSGTMASDSSINGIDGILAGNPQWVDGQIGGALQFDGGDDYVDLGDDPVFNPSGSFSITLWAYITDWSQEWSHVMISNRGELGIGWQLRRNGAWWGLGASDGICFSTGGAGHAGTGINDTPTDEAPPLNQWIHIACVYDNADNNKRIYLDGEEQVLYHTNPGAINPSTYNVYIGARANEDNTGPEAFFTGMLDDVRLYDKALSQAEIASIMDGTLGTVSNYHPVQSSADLHQAELPGSKAVNFRDFAVLADMWLEEQLWP